MRVRTVAGHLRSALDFEICLAMARRTMPAVVFVSMRLQRRCYRPEGRARSVATADASLPLVPPHLRDP